jgi:hypothetical protein
VIHGAGLDGPSDMLTRSMTVPQDGPKMANLAAVTSDKNKGPMAAALIRTLHSQILT